MRDFIQKYAEQIEKEVKINEYKGSHSQYSLSMLFNKLIGEVQELHKSIEIFKDNPGELNNLLSETGDVGAYASFIHDVASKMFSDSIE